MPESDTQELEPGPAAARNESRFELDETREATLQEELKSVQQVNKVIEGVIASLEKAKDNMDTVSSTVTNASSLLNTWTRILSQTEHNQRLILNPEWQGATDDLAQKDNELLAHQQAAQRREIEERQRRDMAALRAEEAERQRTDSAQQVGSGRGRAAGRAGSRGSRGGRLSASESSRGVGHSAGYVGVGGQGGRRARGALGGSGRGQSLVGRGARGVADGRGSAGRSRG